MMNMQPSEFDALSWHDYQGLLWTWNDRHRTDREEDAEAPDSDFVDRIFERLEEAGIVNGSIH